MPSGSTRSPTAGQVDSRYRKRYAREDPSPYDTCASDLGGRSVLPSGKLAKRSPELRALLPTPPELITIHHPQGLATLNTPSSAEIMPILESSYSGSYFQQRNSYLSSSRLTFTFANCFGNIYCNGLSTTNPPALLQRAPLPADSVPHSESIQECLCRLDEMDLSESRILLFEKIHQQMWAKLPTIRFIKWDDLPWPVFVRATCPEDLMLHRIVSYSLQVSSGMDIKEALVDSSRLRWAKRRLRILLGYWGQLSLQQKVEKSADKTMIQGVNLVMNHLESVFVNAHQMNETHHMDLAAIVSQSFLKHVGQNLAWILTDTSDNSGYKSLLRLEGDSAQKMLNFLQAVRHVTAQYHSQISLPPSCSIVRS